MFRKFFTNKEQDYEYADNNSLYGISKELDECLEIMGWPVVSGNLHLIVNPSKKAYETKNECLKIIDVKNDKMARLSLREPRYINHSDFDGRKSWILTNKEKIMIMNLLIESNNENPKLTNWQAIINSYNNELDSEQPEFFLPTDLPIPDYTQLKL